MATLGCGSSGAVDECQISFDRLGGQASERTDVIQRVGDDQYRRTIRESGSTPSGAIFYRYAPGVSESYRAEELDADNDTEVDASMVRSQSLFGLIDLYQVDAVADDDRVDSLQISVPLPSSRFGRWNPARAYYTIPCGPEHSVTANEDAGLLTLSVDISDDGSVDTEMRMFFLDGVLQRWVVDNRVDGTIDFRADISFDDAGRVSAVEWQDWEFAPVSRSEWTYDEEGRLTTFSEDGNGNGVAEQVVTYSASCFPSSPPSATAATVSAATRIDGQGLLALAGGAR